MSKVAILTDSTAYLPQALLAQYQIGVVPLKVIWGEESFDDGVDITPQEFYNRLPASTRMPTTSQVTVGEFQARFEQYHAQGQEVLAILISSAMSGTIDSANQAKALLPQAQIEIVDSLCTTVQLDFLVLAGARCASQGGSLADCKEAVLQARANSGVVFGVDTLEFLYRGGRIGGGKRFMGTVLNIKPILTLNEGRVDALEQVRTRSKSMKRMVEIVAERTAGKTNLRLGVSHANAAQDAEAILALAASQLGPVETLVADLSPAIGTHVGPGTIALAYQFD
jgi:DegV family protein with EDD domain